MSEIEKLTADVDVAEYLDKYVDFEEVSKLCIAEQEELGYNWNYPPFDFDVNDSDISEQIELFSPEKWLVLKEAEKKEVIANTAKTIGDKLGVENIPEVEFYEANKHDCGAFCPNRNVISVNSNNFDNPQEILDTIAHEMRHAYQRYRADLCENAQDELYKFNYEHYISPERDVDGKYVNFFDYYLQYIEVEARAYAKEFTREVA